MLSELTHGLHLGLLFITLFTSSLFYFRIAEHFRIVAPPEDPGRGLVIRGGGLVFILAIYCWFALYRLSFPWFIIGVTVLGVVGYIRDLTRVHPLIVFVAQVTAFAMIMWHTGMYSHPLWLIVVMFVVGAGLLNSFDLMDRANGMTGVYALVNLVTFYYINNLILHFSHTSLIVFMIVAAVVFLYFNFREHPRCLTGHVGSYTLAFVQVFLLLQLIGDTDSFMSVLFFVVNGVDVIMTAISRLRGKSAQHLYQILVNDRGAPAPGVALAYGLMQLLINIVVVVFFLHAPVWVAVIIVVLVVAIYLVIRARVEGLKS